MKILFVADVHIKLDRKNIPNEWSIKRFNMLIKKLIRHYDNEKCSLLIIGGDLFDREPTVKEMQMYFDLLIGLYERAIPTILYPGNHEAVGKRTTFLTHLKEVSSHFGIDIVDEYACYTYGFDILPYNRIKDGPWKKDNEILFTHVRGEIPPHVKPEIDLALLSQWKLVIAGDLHAHSNSQRNIVYPGSPYTITFHRNFQEAQNGLLVVDTDEITWKHIPLDLPQLIRKTVKSKRDIQPTTYHHTIYELEGELEELSEVENLELLDKKITKTESENSLDLQADASIEEELHAYLNKVENIQDPSPIIEEFHNL